MALPRLIVHEHLQHLGWPGAGGALLLLLALGYGVFGLWPGYREAQVRQARILDGEMQLVRLERGEQSPIPTQGRQLDDFHRNLPAQLDATGAIDRIYALATQQGIVLARGEYALGIDPKTQLARYRILLPVRGSYPQLRRFLHGMLEALPALVLEDVDIQRKQIDETQLDGRIRMTLYLSRRP